MEPRGEVSYNVVSFIWSIEWNIDGDICDNCGLITEETDVKVNCPMRHWEDSCNIVCSI